MSGKLPVIRQISTRLFILQCAVLMPLAIGGTFALIPFYQRVMGMDLNAALLVTVATLVLLYVGYVICAQYCILPDINRGIRLLRKRRYQDALECFTRSYETFTQHPQLDRLRWLIKMDVTAWCYRELSMINIAACHFHMNNAALTREWYERTLAEYPDNELAQNAIKAMEMYRSQGGPEKETAATEPPRP